VAQEARSLEGKVKCVKVSKLIYFVLSGVLAGRIPDLTNTNARFGN
jgi:hypothetical protein